MGAAAALLGGVSYLCITESVITGSADRVTSCTVLLLHTYNIRAIVTKLVKRLEMHLLLIIFFFWNKLEKQKGRVRSTIRFKRVDGEFYTPTKTSR